MDQSVGPSKRMMKGNCMKRRWMCGVTRMGKVRNKYIKGILRLPPMTEKLKGNRLSWYGHVMRIDENHETRSDSYLP
jgi:hypothetical protein